MKIVGKRDVGERMVGEESEKKNPMLEEHDKIVFYI